MYLPEEPVLCLQKPSLKRLNNRGPLSPFFNLSVYLQEELVLCLGRLSLMQVKYRWPLPPFFIGCSFLFGRVAAQPAPEKCFKILRQRLGNLLKSRKNDPTSPKLEPKGSQVGLLSQTFLALGAHLRGFVRPGVQVELQVLPVASWQKLGWGGGEVPFFVCATRYTNSPPLPSPELQSRARTE